MLYCKAKFGEGLLGKGAGFGNRLFPWARCRIFSEIHNIATVSPVWVRPAAGQIFRGGIDYKSYLRQLVLWNLFKKREGDLGVFYGNLKIGLLPKLNEPKNLYYFPEGANKNSKAKIIFKNHYTDNFDPLNGWSEFLLRELRKITKPKYLLLADQTDVVPIGIVVRCGNDFAEPSSTARLKFGEKTPISWFVKMLNLIRETVGKNVDAYVVSDGAAQQLAELLTLKNVHFVRPGSAISDLLVISRANVLLGSGSSSFAAWACFLGQMPSASHPGQPLTDWKITPTKKQFIGEVDPEKPSSVFMEHVRKVFGSHDLLNTL